MLVAPLNKSALLTPRNVVDLFAEEIPADWGEGIVGLDTRNVPLFIMTAKVGEHIDSKEMYRMLVASACAGFITLAKVEEGKSFTPEHQEWVKVIGMGGEVLGIKMLDHVVTFFDGSSWISYKQRGMM